MHPRTLSALLLLVLWPGLPGLTRAASGPERGAEHALLDDIPIVSSAGRRAEPVASSPGFVSVLTRADIQASGARNLPELLRRMPGVDVFFHDGVGYEVSLQGLTEHYSNKTLLLIDGKPFTATLRGSDSFDLVPIVLQEVERIEVVRGPVSALYGSNAMAGAINVVTRAVAPDAPAEYWTTVGTGNEYSQGVRSSGRAGRGRFSVVAEHKVAGGFGPQLDANLAPVPTRFRTDHFDNGVVKAAFETVLGEKTELRLDASAVRLDADALMLTSPSGADTLSQALRFSAEASRRDGRHTRKLRIIRDARQVGSDLGPVFSADERRTSFDNGFFDLELFDQIDHGRHQFTFGAGFRHLYAEGFLIEPDSPDIERFTAFADWAASLSDQLRLDVSFLALRQDDGSPCASARMAARYDVTNRDTMRFGLGNSFRTPDPLPLYFHRVTAIGTATASPPLLGPNPDLGDEEASTYQASLEHRDSRGRFAFETSLTRLTGLIDRRAVGPATLTFPSGRVVPTVRGLFVNVPEPLHTHTVIAAAERRLSRRTDLTLRITHQEVDDSRGNPPALFAAPAKKYGLGLRQSVGKRDVLDLDLRRVSSYATADVEQSVLAPRQVPGYDVLDLAYSRVFEPDRRLILAINNLFDERHVEFLGPVNAFGADAGNGLALERRVTLMYQATF
ncbi:MAG: TonB-dependent receptor [Candidatus Wallbacteria bacterium]|nr:TonB-dependent receptor [Candidatus Wallbacteria bacterium]